MRTLLIPCADKRMIYDIPLILQKHPEGVLLAEKAIQGVFPANYDKIVYTVLSEIDDNYHVKEMLIRTLGNKYPIDVLVLPQKTRGPAETVYKTLLMENITGEIVIKDSHSFIGLRQDVKGNFVAGLDLMLHEKYIENLRGKSFIVLNEQGQILDIVEKRFCSDFISIGLYGFKSSDDFKMAFERLDDPDYSIQKLYVSHIISYLIGYKQRVFHSTMTEGYEQWGSQTAWNHIQKKYSTCFLDFDKICGGFPVNEAVMTSLKDASRLGCRFVIFSTNNIDEKDCLDYFQKWGIAVLKVVSKCTASGNKVIIEDLETLNSLIQEA